MGKRELAALFKSSWCLVVVERLFLAVPWGCLRFVIVAFPDHTHLLFLSAFKIDRNLIQISLIGPAFQSFFVKRNPRKTRRAFAPESSLIEK